MADRRLNLAIPLIVLALGTVGLSTVRADVGRPDRVETLLGQMTLREKVGQLIQIVGNVPTDDPVYLRQVAAGDVGSLLDVSTAGLGVDAQGRYSRTHHAAQADAVERTNALQHAATSKGRLHIPLLIAHDIIHGYRTITPVPLGETASFDPSLARADARMAAEECSAVGIRWTFAPMVDVARDPRWGRVVEGSGEDPYLGSAMAVARIEGFQGTPGDPTSVMATAKHYVAYGGVEGGRDYNTVDISERTLRETYLPPFFAAARAGVDSVMVAFNEIGGMPSTCNTHTLNDILRGEWGWNGIVVSDWGSIGELKNHGVAADSAQAAALAMKATVDVDMVSDAYSGHLADLVQAGTISPSLLDDAVRRVLRQKESLGLFDDAHVDAGRVARVMLTPAHRALARDAARRSMVLLKNAGHLLPLRQDVRTLAVVGPLADDQVDVIGPWEAAGQASDVTSVLSGIKTHVSNRTRVLYAPGCSIKGMSRQGFGAAVRAARSADAVVVVVGESGDMSGEAHSRSCIDLPGVQQDLIAALLATHKPVVVVLMNGRPLTIGWVSDHVPALVEAWFGGVEAGPAVADVLFGDSNPAARLPMTFPRTVGQIPLYYNHKNTGRPTISKYDDISNEPLYPFGYGLSYTTFRYANLKVATPQVHVGTPVTVSIDVSNTGPRDGDEVVQLYIHQRVASVTRPVKELKGFHRLPIPHGTTRTVTFTLTPEDLSDWDSSMHFRQEPGTFDVQVGPDSVRGMRSHFSIEP